eukprot:CAMPEP_0114617650 /NCGR_PEP_ID=MMETSP0168-20121206/7304_1 /TAXON_ID=95228 ORGANISM="Vannella sp., Strain DIVA3 517/6/12" /NCGR_SAMPLE_ID=MMETSP0168 /ASSEMBLY_ACC=CAM_ASM_000044 /LENGTH=53 /DNA_ID=CAMNT_0001828787 /DNA_START=61 /DNA_END=223 /DNA_ORIENTATION=+
MANDDCHQGAGGLDHEVVDTKDHEDDGSGPEADPKNEREEADEEAHEGKDEAE